MRSPFTSRLFFFFNDTATTEIYTLSLHDALPISPSAPRSGGPAPAAQRRRAPAPSGARCEAWGSTPRASPGRPPPTPGTARPAPPPSDAPPPRRATAAAAIAHRAATGARAGFPALDGAPESARGRAAAGRGSRAG